VSFLVLATEPEALSTLIESRQAWNHNLVSETEWAALPFQQSENWLPPTTGFGALSNPHDAGLLTVTLLTLTNTSTPTRSTTLCTHRSFPTFCEPCTPAKRYDIG